MKSKLNLLCILLLTIHWGCKFESTSTSLGLTIENSCFATVDEEGLLNPVETDVFKRGEEINFVLINVKTFKKGEDGLNWFDIDMEISDIDGNTVLSAEELLGENGHLNLENNTAESPYAILSQTQNLQPGKYRFKVKIYDKVGNGKATKSKVFTLE